MVPEDSKPEALLGTEDRYARRFALIAAVLAAFIALVPYLLAEVAFKTSGMTYLGMQTAVDDNMVYAAWMKQSMEGHFLFDNRFAIDPQPGLTIHLWFWALGILAKVIGIPLALAVTRAAFSGLFVWIVYGLLRRITDDPYLQKLGVVVTSLGAGLGFLVWQNFGNAFSTPRPLGNLTLQRLPIDVWQGEGFVFPSMLINGLFMVSLCLIVLIFTFVLDSRSTWKPVWKGALSFLVLMNIHSYDVLLVALVLIGFVAATFASKTFNGKWALRVFVMGLGAVPAALYFLHVLQADTVFQARAATPTYSANIRQVIVGYIPLIALGFIGIFQAKQSALGDEETRSKKAKLAVAALTVFMLFLFLAGGNHLDTNTFWLGKVEWAAGFLVAIGLCYALASGKPAVDLIVAWGVVGVIAPYFPALYQRKLTMGYSIPWAILATLGLGVILMNRERGVKNLVSICGLLLLSGTSLQWFQRELFYAKQDVSSTTVHPVYIPRDVSNSISYLNKNKSDREVLLAMPGIARPDGTPGGFVSPYLMDANPILSGLAGVYSVAGHWSETPDYNTRRNEATAFFLDSMPDEERVALISKYKITYILQPNPEAFVDFPELSGGRRFADLSNLGETVVDGNQFKLIKVSH